MVQKILLAHDDSTGAQTARVRDMRILIISDVDANIEALQAIKEPMVLERGALV